jgi:hypothetical protein
MNSGEIVLTFPAACAVCRAPIPHGMRVWWDAGTGEVSCVGPHIAASPAPSAAGGHPLYDEERSAHDRRPVPSHRADDRDAQRYDERYDPRHDRRDAPRYDDRYDDRYDPREDPRIGERYDDRRDDRYDPRRSDRRRDSYDDRRHDPRYDPRYDDRYDDRHDDRYDDRHPTRPVVDTPQQRRWDPLDIDAPDWWSAFDPRSMAPGGSLDDRRPEPLRAPFDRPAEPMVAAPPDTLAPRPDPMIARGPDPVVVPVIAPGPEPAITEQRDTLTTSDTASWAIPPAGARRRHSGLTTVITPGGIAGLPPAHRRTRLARPRSSWDTTSVLNLALGRTGVMLDHRIAPGDDRPLDHVVVAQSGVWVVTVKSSRGLVERRVGSTMANTRDRLLVDGRERHRALRSAHLRTRAVADAVARLGNGWEQVPVHPVLCYVDAEWRPFAQPFEVDGVTVVWPKQFGSVVNVEPVISPRSVEALATHLDAALRRR